MSWSRTYLCLVRASWYVLTVSDGVSYISNELWTDTKNYESRARSIAQGSLFQEGTRHPWAHETDIDDKAPEISSRVQVFEFQGDHLDKADLRQHYDGALDLIPLWEDNGHSKRSGTALDNSQANRRLFIVENMDPLVLELLGVKLNIPPEVFLAHCDPFVNPSVLNNQWETKGPSTYWRVAVPQMCSISSEEKRPVAGHYHIESGRVDRRKTEISDATQRIILFGQVSCWATSYGEGNQTWTGTRGFYSALSISSPHPPPDAQKGQS